MIGELRTYATEVDGTLRGHYTTRDALRSGEIAYSARRLVLACIALGMLYGLCMGSYAWMRGAREPGLQLVASTVKVPMLFLLTLVVTFPSLYVFSALAGSRLAAMPTLRLLLIAITVNLAVLAGFGPVVSFFASCTRSYAFIKLLNVTMFAIAGFLSLVLLRRSLHHAFESDEVAEVVPDEERSGEDQESGGSKWNATRTRRARTDRRAKGVFVVWILMYSVVGAQMGWVLRPFIGTPFRRFEWFRDRESNFFENVLETLVALFT